MRHLHKRTLLLAVSLLSLASTFAGCNGDKKEPEEEGAPTGSTCPAGSTLTYENFAKAFMEAYCTRCHSSQLMGDARNGAPPYHDFDTEVGILSVWEHVDENAAAGPDSVNEIMPPDGAKPTLDERKKLGEWLACAIGGNDAGANTPPDGGHSDAAH